MACKKELTVVDLGYIPPVGGNFGKIGKQLTGLGWNDCSDTDIGTRGGRYRKGDVELSVDDTMLAVFLDSHPTTQTRLIVDEAIEAISDYRKGAGTDSLVFAVKHEHQKATAMNATTDWRGKAAGEMTDMLERQTATLAARVLQRPVWFLSHRDVVMQRARIARWRTSSLLKDIPKERWEAMTAIVDSLEAYIDACFLKSDQIAYIASAMLSFVFSALTVYQLFAGDKGLQGDRMESFLLCMFALVAVWLLALRRK